MDNKAIASSMSLISVLMIIIVIFFGFAVFGTDNTTNVQVDMANGTNLNHTISVSGFAEEKVMPNEAYVYFSIETTADNAKDAQSANAEIWDNLKSELNKNYMKYNTESYNVYPERKWDKVIC